MFFWFILGSVYFTRIRLPYFDFHTLETVSHYRTMLCCSRETGKRLPKYENQSRGAGNGSRLAIFPVGELKAQFGYGSLIMEVGEPKAR